MAAVKTYVLAGHDWNEAFKTELGVYATRANTVILRPMPGQSLDTVLRSLQPPAHIILACHGGSHDFTWHSSENVRYRDFYRTLPSGIESIGLVNCYGESGVNDVSALKQAPAGALVYAIAGEATVSNAIEGTAFAQQSRDLNAGTDLALEAMDAMHPEGAAKNNAWRNKSNPYFFSKPLPVDAHKVMVHTVGIGGANGQVIDLQKETARLQHEASHRHIDLAVAKAAIELATARINSGLDATHASKDHRSDAGRIGDVAYRFFYQGQPIVEAEDQRVAQALTLAYLQKSGELDRRIAQAKTPHADIAALPSAVADAQANGVAARRCGNARHDAMPIIQQSQVETLQRALLAAGASLGHFGAQGVDGQLGHYTLQAIGAVAKQAGVTVDSIDFTNKQDAEFIAFNRQLTQLQRQRGTPRS